VKPRSPVRADINVDKRGQVDGPAIHQVGREKADIRMAKAHPPGLILAALLVAEFFWAQSATATVVLVLGTRERIVVAADSRMSWVTALDAEPTRFKDTECKVLLDSPLVLGIAGVQRGDDFDVPIEWMKLRGRGDTVFERAAALNAALAKLDVRQAPFTAPLTVVVAGFFRRDPAAALTQFELRPGEPHPIRVKQNGGAATPLVLVVGESESVDDDALHVRLKQPITEQELVALAEKTIHEEALHHRTVGGDIDVAVIDGKGARWVHVKRQCEQPASQEPMHPRVSGAATGPSPAAAIPGAGPAACRLSCHARSRNAEARHSAQIQMYARTTARPPTSHPIMVSHARMGSLLQRRPPDRAGTPPSRGIRRSALS